MGSSMGSYKLNTSGVGRKNRELSGYGGILRDERARWIRGFMGHLGIGSGHIDAEIWAIFKGVELVNSLRLQNTTLETDSFNALSILEEPDSYTENPILRALISDCQKSIKKNGITLSCIPPDENKCAGFLAELAMDDDDDDDDDDAYTDVLDPPPGIESLIMADKGNVALG